MKENQVQHNLLQMEPSDLLEYLTREFSINIPVNIDTVEDLNYAGTLLGKCASNYSFLITQAMMAKLIKRNLKMEKADKAEVDRALSREEILTMFADITKTSYNAISRMITVRSQASEELKMLHST